MNITNNTGLRPPLLGGFPPKANDEGLRPSLLENFSTPLVCEKLSKLSPENTPIQYIVIV